MSVSGHSRHFSHPGRSGLAQRADVPKRSKSAGRDIERVNEIIHFRIEAQTSTSRSLCSDAVRHWSLRSDHPIDDPPLDEIALPTAYAFGRVIAKDEIIAQLAR